MYSILMWLLELEPLKIYGENISSKIKWADICSALMGVEHGFIWLHNVLSLNTRYCNGINLDGTVSLHFFLDVLYHIEVVRCHLSFTSC
jgi:hypothetical protein